MYIYAVSICHWPRTHVFVIYHSVTDAHSTFVIVFQRNQRFLISCWSLATNVTLAWDPIVASARRAVGQRPKKGISTSHNHLRNIGIFKYVFQVHSEDLPTKKGEWEEQYLNYRRFCFLAATGDLTNISWEMMVFMEKDFHQSNPTYPGRECHCCLCNFRLGSISGDLYEEYCDLG